MVSEDFFYFGKFHVDHVIALYHGGTDEVKNLAMACPICNCLKGTNIASWLARTDEIMRLYHPRKDKYGDHFALQESGVLVPTSTIGEVTIQLLKLNAIDSVAMRRALIGSGSRNWLGYQIMR